ncbi:MAG: HlyC/CorC family transporter [Deltaproteobacteria bacterium]|nr:HlyC/CorC family transporter [Deltaproteobacteria bacterium]
MADNPEDRPPSFIDQVRSLFKKRTEPTPESLLEKDFQELIDQGEEQGLLTPEQGDMIQSIFEFKDTIVREIMIPRTEIIAVAEEVPIQAIIDLMVKHGHSRIPIYKDNLDNVTGLLHVKDLLPYWGTPTSQSLPLEVIRQPIFVPETKKIVQLLKELRGQRFHMAVVLDEYGGTSGLVTMEDIIEEIIGEIEDEYDRREPRLILLEEGKVEVDARLEIEELERHFDLEIAERDYESVGGLIIHLLGRVPKVGEKIYYRDLEITVLDGDNRRVRRLRIEKMAELPPEPFLG